MKVGLVQNYVYWEDKEKSISEAFDVIKEQALLGTEMVFFPEMSFTGFSMNTTVTGEKDRQTAERISNYAKENHIGVGFGWVRQKEKKCENVYSIVDKSGDLLSEYVKIHPFSFSEEDKFFDGGTTIFTYKINDIPFSTFICYDLRFPELFRAVAKNCHVIVVPACWPHRRSYHWEALLRARAIENQVYILAVNCQGDIGEVYYSGDSCVIDPNGEILMSLKDKTGVLQFDLDDNTNCFRSAFPVLDDIIDVSELSII